MEKMKTFLMYLIIIVLFFVVSKVLEQGFIQNMYNDMTGTIDSELVYGGETIDLQIEVQEAKATRQNGYINLKVKNTSTIYIAEAYLKVNLYTKNGVEAVTKYMEIDNLNAGEEKTYTLRFKGSYITTYAITSEKDYPDKEYIFNFFGYDMDIRNVFGRDLSDVIDVSSISGFGKSIFYTIKVGIQSIPWWAWLWAWTICVGLW